MPENAILQAALELARLGYRVLPVRPKSKQPSLAEWTRLASADEAVLRGWFQNPYLNLGVLCGTFFVLDFDDSELAASWPDPERNAELRAAAIAITRTPRGGTHMWFPAPEGLAVRNSVGKLAPKLDVRGSGGFIVVPPSVTLDGQYRWEKTPLALADARPAPAWLVNLLSARAPAAGPTLNGSANGATRGHVLTEAESIPEGKRHATLVRLAGTLRDKGLTPDEISVLLHAVNQKRCCPPLPDPEVEGVVRSAARWRPGHLPVAPDDGDVVLAEVQE